ncbi:MAG: hypothetical protein QOJ64_4449 [Acidobacteriota bacterium]|nr:hypothetical protein [Acidobacteriota bacterium]
MTKLDRKLVSRTLSFLILIGLIAFSALPAAAQRRRVRRPVRRVATAPAVPPVRYHSLAANTVIRVRINQEISSRNARVGDRFSTNVTEPVYATGGVEVIPVGSKVWGRVASVRQAGRRTPGNISVSFYQVELPNGVSRSINGSLTSLQADDVNSDNEGTVTGRSNRKRDAVFIGGGAATGAIIGAIAGGGKGAAIGAILGGGLGTGARVYENEQDADVKSGTQFGVILNQSVSLPKGNLR